MERPPSAAQLAQNSVARNLHLVELDLPHPAHEAGQQPSRETRGARVHHQQADALMPADSRGAYQRCRGLRVMHEQLRPAQDVARIRRLGAHLDRLRSPAVLRLRQRESDYLPPGGDVRKPASLPLLAARLRHDKRAQNAGREERPRQRPRAKLLIHHRRVRQRTPAAAVLLRHQHTQPAYLRSLLPDVGGKAHLGFVELQQRLFGAFALHEVPRCVSQKFLFLGKRQVHLVFLVFPYQFGHFSAENGQVVGCRPPYYRIVYLKKHVR